MVFRINIVSGRLDGMDGIVRGSANVDLPRSAFGPRHLDSKLSQVAAYFAKSTT